VADFEAISARKRLSIAYFGFNSRKIFGNKKNLFLEVFFISFGLGYFN
tara:strand:+ start:4981 stop:5124 length:144 start_codon:yes stop_codon:yes gene_type:complete